MNSSLPVAIFWLLIEFFKSIQTLLKAQYSLRSLDKFWLSSVVSHRFIILSWYSEGVVTIQTRNRHQFAKLLFQDILNSTPPKKYLFSQGWSLGLPLDLPLGFPYDQLAQWHCSVHIEGEPQHVLAQGPLWLETARTYGRQPISADGWNGWTRTLKNTLTSLRKSLRTHSSSYTQGAWSKIEWWSDGFPGWFGGFHGHRGTPKSSI